MKSVLVVVLAAVQLATGVIYHLSDAEYARMPNLFQLDDYNDCLRESGDLYCNVDAKLVANDTNELYTLIREYSDNAVTHYDHTEIHWGVCVTKMCGEFIEGSNLRRGLEACLNATLYDNYQMGAKLIHKTTVCTGFGESPEFDLADSLFAVVVAAILLLNGLGTFYGVYNNGSKSFVSKILLCFSLKRSWERFTMPSGAGPDRRLRQLTSLNGFKVMSTLLVIVAHSALTGLTFIDNPQTQENTYQNPLYQIMYNGTFIVQTFFTISGFLLAYNMLVSTEERPAGCGFLPKAVLLRWLRLVPTYALILAFICTWLRHLGSGPLWKPVVDIEIKDCRRDWWLHLLFIDNYIDKSQCMAQTWYLSSDMQLSVLGLLIFCALQSSRARAAAIAVIFVIGLLTPAVHTYVQDLYPILVVAPELARRYFVEDPTFNNLYKRGHTNLVCYSLGLALGMLVYNLHNNDFDVKKCKKYRLFYWGAFPVGLAVIFSGMIFYVDGFELPLAIRVVYSSVVRLIFGLCITLLIAGTILKIENVYRPILEWNGWAPMSRLSYCAYLLHVTVVRTSVLHYSTLQHNSFYKMVINFFGVAGVSYALAVVCWMLVEAPVQSLIKVCFTQREQKKCPEVCDVRKEVET